MIPLLRDELEALTDGNFELVAADEGGDRIAAVLVYPARQTADIAPCSADGTSRR